MERRREQRKEGRKKRMRDGKKERTKEGRKEGRKKRMRNEWIPGIDSKDESVPLSRFWN